MLLINLKTVSMIILSKEKFPSCTLSCLLLTCTKRKYIEFLSLIKLYNCQFLNDSI